VIKGTGRNDRKYYSTLLQGVALIDNKLSFQDAPKRLKALLIKAQGNALGKMNGIISDAP
jgi:hypothetical protein